MSTRERTYDIWQILELKLMWCLAQSIARTSGAESLLTGVFGSIRDIMSTVCNID